MECPFLLPRRLLGLPFVLIPNPLFPETKRAIYVQHPRVEGIMRMLGRLLPEDRVAVVSFSKLPGLRSALTYNRLDTRDAIERAMRERDYSSDPPRSAIYDAVEYASAIFHGEPRIGRRRVMFLITHNRDGSVGPDRWVDAAESLLSADIVLSVLVVPGIGTREFRGGGIFGGVVWPPKVPGVLPELNSVEPLVEATAGEIFRDPSDDFWRSVIDRLGSRYRLGFYPDNGDRRISGHSLEVALTPQARIRWPSAIIRVPEAAPTPIPTHESLNPAP